MAAAARRRPAAPPKPQALDRYPAAAWDARAGVWRDGEFWYDDAAADAAVAFFHRHLCFTEGEWAGRPFLLSAWQEHDIVRPLFGWKSPDDRRRYTRCYVWVPRKNGKTELAAGVALLALLGDGEPSGQVYSIAAEKPQASIVFNKAANMVARSATLSGLLECLKETIYCPELNASFRPLSGKAKGKHGLSMSGLVGDEVHEWPNGDLYTFVHDSAAARRQPLEFLISTAGVNGSHGEDIWTECKRIADGEVDDPGSMVVIYAADPEDDWTDPKVWAKANPNLGVSVKVDGPSGLAAQCRLAQQLPRLENDFKRYRLNIWTDQAVRWLPMDGVDDEGRRFGWDHCKGPIGWRDLEVALRHKRCFGGLDLSSTTDLAALLWWFPIQPGLVTPACLVRFFKPKALVEQHKKRDRVPYDDFVRQGALIATEGNVVDYTAIQAQVMRDAELFKVAYTGGEKPPEGSGGLAIDRWNATETATRLAGEGLPIVLYGQGFASLSAPSKELERLVLGNGFHHGGHPLLRRHAQAVAVESDAAGNIKPAKNKSTLRIDGIAAMVNAIGIASRDQPPADIEKLILAGGGLR